MSDIPTAAISRLVTYLRILEQLEAKEISRTSSSELSELAGVTAFQVRKDLAYFGRFGTRGMGYTVPLLKRELLRVLGLDQTWNVVIIGMGRLGQAIANYSGASEYRFRYVGLFDINRDILGKEICDLRVQHMSELRDFVEGNTGSHNQVDMGFIAVPPENAQNASQSLVSAGVKSILNFAPLVIKPRITERAGIHEVTEEWSGVIIENVDFLAGMKRLAFYTLNPHLRSPELDH